jgi:hypothetical protein
MLGGNLHLYVRNDGAGPASITDALVEGISLKEAIVFRPEPAADLRPASIFFSKLEPDQIGRLGAAGEPVWWHAQPDSIPPGGYGELVIRLRRHPESARVRLALKGDAWSASTEVPVTEEHPRIVSINFSPALDGFHLYARHPQAAQTPSRILLDGRDVTAGTAFGSARATGTALAVVRLDAPLEPGSFHLFEAVYADGSTATAALRAWHHEFIYGMWGYSRRGSTEEERVKLYLAELELHQINALMHSYGGEVAAYMRSEEGRAHCESIGMRAMATSPGNVPDPLCYFLMDEPDAQDYAVSELEPHQRLGSYGQTVVNWSRLLRDRDPGTPTLLNIDNTYKPNNWYMYGQLSDIYCADPYYPEMQRDILSKHPGWMWAHLKPTYVYGVGTICHSSGAPRPLHLILHSVRHDTPELPFRFPTPEEKRIEVFYALASGARRLSYWWYTPYGDLPGCGLDDPAARALWTEIGLVGAEVRTAGELIARSCPADLEIEASRLLWVRGLLAGLDAVVLLVVNDEIASDRVGMVYRPVGRAAVQVKLPEWLKPVDTFEITTTGISDVEWEHEDGRLAVNLGQVDLTRLVIASSDPKLRGRLQTLHERRFAANVKKLLAARLQ